MTPNKRHGVDAGGAFLLYSGYHWPGTIHAVRSKGGNMRLLTVITLAAAVLAMLPTGCSRHESKDPAGDSTSSTRVRAVDQDNFDAEIRNGVVLVDFWAVWCGPCKMQAPIVEQVAAQVEGKARVVKVDVDAAPDIAQRLGIQAIPTVVVFKNGKPEKRFVGVTQADTLVSAVTSVLDSH